MKSFLLNLQLVDEETCLPHILATITGEACFAKKAELYSARLAWTNYGAFNLGCKVRWVFHPRLGSDKPFWAALTALVVMSSLSQNDFCLFEKRVFAVVATVAFITVLKSIGCQWSLKWIRCYVLWWRDKLSIGWHSIFKLRLHYRCCILQLELLGLLRFINRRFWGLSYGIWTVYTNTLLYVDRCLSLSFHSCGRLNKFLFAILFIFL